MNDTSPQPIKGAIPVLVMPFTDDGAVDEDSLRRQLDFSLEAGSQAIAFGWGSESQMLTDSERQRVWTLTVQHLDSRLPVIAATADKGRERNLELAKLALGCGVDCAMVNPDPLGGDALVDLFRRLSEQVPLSLMVQDAGGNAPAEVLLQAVQSAPRVCCLKLESAGAPDKMASVLAGLAEGMVAPSSTRSVTVLGGSNGHHLLEELARGAVGTLPHPAFIDAYRTVCDCYAKGDVADGKAYYKRIISPLNDMIAAGGGGSMIWFHKLVFQRAGILRSTYCRVDAQPVSDAVLTEAWKHLDGTGLLVARRGLV